MMRYSNLLAAAVAVAFAAPIGAQEARANASQSDLPPAVMQSTTAPSTPSTSASVATPAPRPGPTMDASVAGIRTQSANAKMPAPVAVDRVGRNPALMIVGGAALVVGAIIGGDAGTIIMVGGAVTGLVGLWNFLR